MSAEIDSAIKDAIVAEMCKGDFLWFSRVMFKKRNGFKWSLEPYHSLLAAALMRVYDGYCTRLIINIPPRYGKTELAVVNFIAWCFGHHPDSEFIHTSYSADLAAENSRKTKDIVEHPFYKKIFPGISTTLAQAHWRTRCNDKEGRMYSAGSGGTLTGFGAGKVREGFSGAIIIDDPHKADEASSEKVRKGVIEWFVNTLSSRKNSAHTPVILIMQRLHEDDLSGWLLKGGNGEEWEHLCLPAITEDGAPLCPRLHSLEDLRTMERATPYRFAGQYMQRPAPLKGGFFKPHMMPIIDAAPNHMRVVRYWDLAATADGGDATAGMKLGLTKSGQWVIADGVVGNWAPEERNAAMLNTAKADGLNVQVGFPQNPGDAGIDQKQALGKLFTGFSFWSNRETGQKWQRAEAFAAQVNVGNVSMVRGPWNEKLINEMNMFPNGKNDDQIDSLSGGFSKLVTGEYVGATAPVEAPQSSYMQGY